MCAQPIGVSCASVYSAPATRTLVIGSGLAGLYFSLCAADQGPVVLVTKASAGEGSTGLAQGGIAAVLGPDDSLESHVADTLKVGAGLCREDIVRLTIAEGPRHIDRLVELGVKFARSEDGALDLGREGGHSERRVAHSGDITGAAIQRALLARVGAHPNVTILEGRMAVDLLTTEHYGMSNACCGAYLLETATGRVEAHVADHVVLATGGTGQTYRHTSNPGVSTGDGIAMAYRAGARVTNMEFVQFHPTLLARPLADGFLISEALRGEGGILQLDDGTPFMDGVHELSSLAPRDIVARTIDMELKRSGARCVFLDMTHLHPEHVAARFPGIHARCLEHSIDMRSERIPVVPGAHYSCGGVEGDSWGRTSLRNLQAIGGTIFCAEVAKFKISRRPFSPGTKQ